MGAGAGTWAAGAGRRGCGCSVWGWRRLAGCSEGLLPGSHLMLRWRSQEKWLP